MFVFECSLQWIIGRVKYGRVIGRVKYGKVIGRVKLHYVPLRFAPKYSHHFQ
jgi:hypothetical protein